MIRTIRGIDPNVLLMEQLERLICERTGGGIQSLQVDIQPSEVILRGQTKRYYNKQLATHAVQDLLEERSLANEIEVV
ncbi:MAG: hypothetical protein U0903_12070 [Planctomycetales bacterium]